MGLLVISCEQSESIVIGEKGMVLEGPIVVTIVRPGRKVRLGVVAARQVPVLRRELYERIHGPLEPGQVGTAKLERHDDAVAPPATRRDARSA